MSKTTLYQLLGLPTTATDSEVRSAYRRELAALEERRAQLTPDEFRERRQLLLVANDTLSDRFLRERYDAELNASGRTGRAAVASGALVNREQVRAEALGLRADALSLRAEAILARADLDAFGSRESTVASGLRNASKLVVRAIGLLVVVGVATFGVTRCTVGDSAEKRAAAQARAAEQAALQDYYQTYGVRPANLAELELMEAERRRKENEARLAEQERRRHEDEQRRWEQDARRFAERTTQELRAADERALRQAERAQELKFREEQLQLELQLARSETERRRLELQIKQTRERREQP